MLGVEERSTGQQHGRRAAFVVNDHRAREGFPRTPDQSVTSTAASPLTGPLAPVAVATIRTRPR